jgi:hypothetical protein
MEVHNPHKARKRKKLPQAQACSEASLYKHQLSLSIPTRYEQSMKNSSKSFALLQRLLHTSNPLA